MKNLKHKIKRFFELASLHSMIVEADLYKKNSLMQK